MESEDAAPSHGTCAVDAYQRVWMVLGLGKQAGAGPISGLPIAAFVRAQQVTACRKQDGHNDEQQEGDEHFLHGDAGRTFEVSRL